MSILRVECPRKLIPLIAHKRYKGACGGRGGCKSHFFAEQAVLRCVKAETRVVCVREVQNSIKKSVKQLIEDKIRKLGVSDLFTILETEIRHRHNGSIIVFVGMQAYNADNIKSLEGFDIAWVEEAQTLSQYSLDLLRPTIRKPGSELWFSWNPKYKTDAVDRLFRGPNPPSDSICVFINWDDNPWFKTTPLYQDMLDDYAADPDKAEHVWGGGYGQSTGAILAKWVNHADREGRINNAVVYDPSGADLIISSDLGYRDTCSWWYWQPIHKGYNVLKYDFDHGLDADDWIPRIQANISKIGAKLGKIWLPHDARVKTFQSKHSSQEKFMRSFGPGKVQIVPQTKKGDQIEAARNTIKLCQFNASECDAGLDGLRAWEFVYSEDAGVFSREPNHNWASHPSDAFSYGCQVVAMQEPKEKPEDMKFWDSKTLEELWKDNPKKGSRI